MPPLSDTPRKDYMKEYRQKQQQAGARRVSVTLTPSEYQTLSRNAKKHQERVTTHLKALALAQLEERHHLPPDIETRLDHFIAIMRGVGNNINQMAKHSNEMRRFLDHAEIRKRLYELETHLIDFVGKPLPVTPATQATKPTPPQ